MQDHAPKSFANSFEELWERAGPRLKGLLWSYRIPVDDAEDLLQDTFYSLVYSTHEINDPEAWLLGTLKRQCLMYWRKRRRSLYAAVDETLLEWLATPIAPPQEREQLLADLESLIERLPPKCRKVLRLRFQLGYEPQEVAEKLGYSSTSIGKITQRCLAALSHQMFLAQPANRGRQGLGGRADRGADLLRR
jgi:RNA polymerase sigma-70 factor (ECF subfamily)